MIRPTLHYMRWFGYSMSVDQLTVTVRLGIWVYVSAAPVRYTRSFSYRLINLIFTTDKEANAIQLVAPRPRH